MKIQPHSSFAKLSSKDKAGAFTLTEGLVVVAGLALLAVLFLAPCLLKPKALATSAMCLNNLKQLSAGWLEYTEDNLGKLVPNGSEGEQGTGKPSSPDFLPGGQYAQWCPGRQDPGDEDALAPANLAPGAANIGYQWIQAGLLFQYVNQVSVYLCPADTSFNLLPRQTYPHVRSESMNAWLQPLPLNSANPPWNGGSDDAQLRVFTREEDLTVPGPRNTFLFIDENASSINDASFVADPTEHNIGGPEWIDCPANYHNNGAGISFCDGHALIQRWSDQTILNQPLPGPVSFPWNYPATPSPPTYFNDILWVANRATALESTQSFLGPP